MHRDPLLLLIIFYTSLCFLRLTFLFLLDKFVDEILYAPLAIMLQGKPIPYILKRGRHFIPPGGLARGQIPPLTNIVSDHLPLEWQVMERTVGPIMDRAANHEENSGTNHGENSGTNHGENNGTNL